MTFSDFFSFFSAAVAVFTAIMIVRGFRRFNAQQSTDSKAVTERMNKMEFEYKRDLERLQILFDGLKRKHLALPCWEKVKTDEAATDSKVVDDDAPRRSIHVVSISNGGSLSEMLGEMLGEAISPKLMVARRLFSVVEDDKKTAAQLLSAMASVDDKEVLEVALKGLIEREDYEFVQLVKDEIAFRNAQKTGK